MISSLGSGNFLIKPSSHNSFKYFLLYLDSLLTKNNKIKDFVIFTDVKIFDKFLKKNNFYFKINIVNKEIKKTHWRQSVPISCWLYAVGVAEFAVDYVDYFEGKSIQTWVYKQDSPLPE